MLLPPPALAALRRSAPPEGAIWTTSVSVAPEQAGPRQRLQHRLQLLRQEPLALRLQVLEVRIARDRRFHIARAARRLAHCVLQCAEEACQHRALLANLLGQPLQTARFPEVAFVAHRKRGPTIAWIVSPKRGELSSDLR